MELKGLEALLKDRTPGLMDSKRAYAVLVPLVEQNGELCLLYEVRARTLRRQPGEVCFPGGLMEKGETPEDCALRETWEELAIPDRCVRLLGRLDFIAHRANFIMYPILGLVDSQDGPQPRRGGGGLFRPPVPPAQNAAHRVHL